MRLVFEVSAEWLGSRVNGRNVPVGNVQRYWLDT